MGKYVTNDIVKTCILLLISCSVMVTAWYSHLKFESWSIGVAILFSWGLAFFEYLFMVPANRIGTKAGLSPAKLRGIAELFILTAFIIFQTFVLGANLEMNHIIGFGMVLMGVCVVLFGPFRKVLYSSKI